MSLLMALRMTLGDYFAPPFPLLFPTSSFRDKIIFLTFCISICILLRHFHSVVSSILTASFSRYFSVLESRYLLELSTLDKIRSGKVLFLPITSNYKHNIAYQMLITEQPTQNIKIHSNKNILIKNGMQWKDIEVLPHVKASLHWAKIRL